MCSTPSPSSTGPELAVKSMRDTHVNLKLQNILMLLKRCCNHPYLVEYPLDPATQEFKVTTRGPQCFQLIFFICLCLTNF